MLSSKLLIVPSLCFAAILLGWSLSLLSLGGPSINSLENQISSLRRELQGFDEMKEEYIWDEIELSWDQQHLQQLNEQQAQLNGGFSTNGRVFQTRPIALRNNQKEMNKALSELRASNYRKREQDMDLLRHFSEESAKVHQKVDYEHRQNLVLKDILGKMKLLLDVDKEKQLRGTQKSTNSRFARSSYTLVT
jgi:hypothetical protein